MKPLFYKECLFAVSFVVILFCSCSKSKDLKIQTNPEARNQEGSRLLGTSRVDNGYIRWTTFYYEGNSNRILRITDSSMSVTDLSGEAEEVVTYFYNYNAAGKLVSLVSSSPDSTTQNFIYNSANKLVERNLAPVGKFIYTYGPNGRVAADSIFDLVKNYYVNCFKYQYDAESNIVAEEQWEYDSTINNLAKVADLTYTYDDKKNPYLVIDSLRILKSFGYNPHNYTHVVSKFSSGTFTRVLTYEYNNAGFPKKVTSTFDTTTVIDKYYYY